MTAGKPYHHGNLRAALIEAGLAALEQSDSKEISLRALAREIGVSANAAYRHFEDKNALLSALATEGFRRFTELQKQAVQGHTDAPSARQASGQAYIDFARANPALFRLMFGHFLHASTDPDLRQAAMESFQGLLEGSAVDTGTPPDDERAILTAILRWSLVHGLSHLALDGQLDVFSDKLDKLIDDVLTLSKTMAVAAAQAHAPQPAKKAPAARKPQSGKAAKKG